MKLQGSFYSSRRAGKLNKLYFSLKKKKKKKIIAQTPQKTPIVCTII